MIRDYKFILKAVASFYGITSEDITGYSRKRHIFEARMVCAKIMREFLGMTYPSIGDALNRDHSTIIKTFASNKDNERVLEVLLRFKSELHKASLHDRLLEKSMGV